MTVSLGGGQGNGTTDPSADSDLKGRAVGNQIRRTPTTSSLPPAGTSLKSEGRAWVIRAFPKTRWLAQFPRLEDECMCWFSAEYANQIEEAKTGQRLGIKKMQWHTNWVVRETELDASRPCPVCLIDRTRVLFRFSESQQASLHLSTEAEAVCARLRTALDPPRHGAGRAARGGREGERTTPCSIADTFLDAIPIGFDCEADVVVGSFLAAKGGIGKVPTNVTEQPKRDGRARAQLDHLLKRVKVGETRSFAGLETRAHKDHAATSAIGCPAARGSAGSVLQPPCQRNLIE